MLPRPLAAFLSGAVASQLGCGEADTMYRRSFGYDPKPYTPERVNSMMVPVLSYYRSGPEEDRVIAANAVRAAMSLPPFQPPVSEARLADDEVLWIAREGDAFLPATEWVLIGRDGEALGVVEHPANVTLHWSRGSTVWASLASLPPSLLPKGSVLALPHLALCTPM